MEGAEEKKKYQVWKMWLSIYVSQPRPLNNQ